MSGWRAAVMAAIGSALLAACQATPDRSTTASDDDARLNSAAAQLDNAANLSEPQP